MKILIATTNHNKVKRIKSLIEKDNIELISLRELDYKIEEPEETGKNGLENAIIKAKYYHDNLKEKMAVLTQDDTLFLSSVSENDNPQKDIKLPVIKKYGEFTDENAYDYYSNLVKKYNKEYLEFEFQYGHALCGESFLKGSKSVLSGRLYHQINHIRTPGYFLSDMIKVMIDGKWKYYSELSENELIQQDQNIKISIDGIIDSFIESLNN
jgi:hypothetical protein